MTVNARRVTDAYFDQSLLDAVGRSTNFARRALRAHSAFFWSSACEPAALIGRAGEANGIDADALATSFATEVLSASGPIALGASCALGGVAVRAANGARGVLFVADPAPRAFSAEDLALIDEVGASLTRELERGSQMEIPRSQSSVPLDTLVELSDALVQDAGSAGAIAPRCLSCCGRPPRPRRDPPARTGGGRDTDGPRRGAVGCAGPRKPRVAGRRREHPSRR